MRKIVILRGAQGAGKSTFIRKQGLEGFTLSPDTVRILMGGVVMSPEGRIGIMRSLKDRIIKMRETGGDLRRDISSPEALAFYEWAMTQPNEMLEKDIITLRKNYLASFS